MPLGSLNSFLSYAPQLSGAKSCCLVVYIFNSLFTIRSSRCSGWLLLALPHFLSNHHGDWWHLLDCMCCLLGALIHIWGFHGSSAGKESTCNAGDPGSITGSGSPGEGIDYPFQYSWASLVAQMVKNPPATRETWVQSLGWEDPLEEGLVQYPCLENHHRQRNLVGYSPWGLKESDMTQQLSMHSTEFTFGDPKSLMAMTFLAHQHGGKYFISQK